MDTEDFGGGASYEEATVKCYCCGRLIPAGPIEHETRGAVRLYCSDDCIQVYARYREPYLQEPEVG